MPYLREELSRVDESWAAARFDSLPHVVHILTSKDREGEVRVLKEQSDVIEEVVDEVVHAYHGGFNKAIQNYSQILRLFSESAQSIGVLKVDLAEAKKLLGAHNKQLHQLWYRSVTLRHIISLLDQIEGIAKVPARIEKLIAEKQFYAAVQLHVQSALMLEREGLQSSECQHLICEILRATPEAASADAAAQTARLASKVPADKRQAHIVILSSDVFLHNIDFPSCDASVSMPNQGKRKKYSVTAPNFLIIILSGHCGAIHFDGLKLVKWPVGNVAMRADHVRQGWRRGSNVLQEGYGTGAVLPEQGIYLAASVYRPVIQVSVRVEAKKKYSACSSVL
ncbi:UNVERIFIED_CONTAM: Exocyst complex component SEC8 [Sesamum radiatum]|uniref:Exocyst complex component Sec8 n=1 Tax=Sesamum radiatum TaxID=300843 RepID=A0AAW2KAG7_SESRA